MSPRSSLTEAQLARRNAEIRRLRQGGVDILDIAGAYSLSRRQVQTVLRRFGLVPRMPAHLAKIKGSPRTEAQAAFLTEMVRRHRVIDKLYPPFPHSCCHPPGANHGRHVTAGPVRSGPAATF